MSDSLAIYNGNVGIGTTSPSQKLSIGSVASGGNVKIANGWLCVDDNDTCTGATTAGTIYATNGTVSGGADVAENYPTQDKTLEPGDIVSASAGFPIHITKSRVDDDSRGILGVVSTKPGVLLGHNGNFANASTVPVALVGRVPVKVTNENGDIKPGDYLTISKTRAGYATKAIDAGYVIGQALENHNNDNDNNNDNTILVFINKTYFVPKVADLLQNGQNFGLSGEALNLNNAYAFNDLVVINTMYVGEKLVVKEIIETVELIADTVTAKEKVCIGQTCVTEEQLKAVLKLLDDQQGSVAGASTQVPEPEAPIVPPVIPPSTPDPVIDPPAEDASPPISEPAPSELPPAEVLPVTLPEPVPAPTE